MEKEVSIRFIERYPIHNPRKSDANYKYFIAAKKRMKKAGLLKCAIDSDYHWGNIELHHSVVEFGHINDVDIDKLNELYGLHLTDEEFKIWVEGPGNLEPLCTYHHRGVEGVHSLPEPEWNILRIAKRGENILQVESNNLIPVTKEPK